jgi:hypothetical protein
MNDISGCEVGRPARAENPWGDGLLVLGSRAPMELEPLTQVYSLRPLRGCRSTGERYQSLSLSTANTMDLD